MRRTWIAGGTVLVLLAAAAVVGGLWWSHRGPDYPDHWDARVLPLVKYVEKERGLTFDHPVYVDFLSDADFNSQVTKKASELSDQDRKDIEDAEAEMRALGLIGPKVDLLRAVNQMQAGGIIGLYDYEDKRVRVRGSKLTLDVRSTLVHELTHVLQDQHFDLEARSKGFEEDDDSEGDDAWTAVIEGDADRIEEKWDAELPAAQRRQLAHLQQRTNRGAQKKLAKVPAFLTTSLQASYALGGAFLSLADAQDGNSAIDDVFSDPPTDGEQLLDPWVYLADHQDAVDVPNPAIGKSDEELETDTFGAPGLAFLLAERIDPAIALRAADGWGGDATIAYRHGKQTCMRMDYVGDSQHDTTELRAALRRWIAAGPSGVATVTPHGKGLRFTACDAGNRTRPGTGGSEKVLELSAARTAIATQVVKQGAPAAFVRCYVGKVVDRYGAQLLDDAAMSSMGAADFAPLAQACKP